MPTYRYRDQDKNVASVECLTSVDGQLRLETTRGALRKAVVAIHAEGIWFTPAQAHQFARAIHREARKAKEAQKAATRKPTKT